MGNRGGWLYRNKKLAKKKNLNLSFSSRFGPTRAQYIYIPG